MEKLPVEIICHILDLVGNTKQLLECRLANRQLSSAGSMALRNRLKALRLPDLDKLSLFNSIMLTSTNRHLFTEFEISPSGFLIRKESKTFYEFLDLMSPTARTFILGLGYGGMFSKSRAKYEIHGRLLSQLLVQSSNLTSLTVSFEHDFILEEGCLKSLELLQLRHLSLIFPHLYYCREDQHRLVEALLTSATVPQLKRLDITFEFKRNHRMEMLVRFHVLEVLKKLKPSVQLGITARPKAAESTLTELMTLPNKICAIDISSKTKRWAPFTWTWAQNQAQSLKSLSAGAFPASEMELKPFSKLDSLTLFEMRDLRKQFSMARAFETLRVLHTGRISHHSAIFHFVTVLPNLEDLSMHYENYRGTSCWFGITGERKASNVTKVLKAGFVSNADDDASLSPFKRLTKLKRLGIRSSVEGILGILRISKQAALKPLDHLEFWLPRYFQYNERLDYTSPEILGQEIEDQLMTYHRKATYKGIK